MASLSAEGPRRPVTGTDHDRPAGRPGAAWRLLLVWQAVALLGAAPPERTVRIAWFGGTGGVSGHAPLPRAAPLLHGHESLKAVEPVAEGPQLFARDGRLVFGPEGLKIEDFREFLAAAPFRRTVIDAARQAAVGPFDVVFAADPPASGPTAPRPGLEPHALLPGGQRVTARLVRYEARNGAAVLALELPDAPADAALETDPARWELRWASVLRATPKAGPPALLVAVERPLHEGARRVRALEALRPDLVLAGGGDVEDFSFVATGEPDRQRPHTWRAYERLGVDAVAPGAAELAFGAEVLRGEAARAGVAVLAANVAAGEVGPPPFPGWKTFDVDGVRLLVVGLADPDLGVREAARAFGDRPLRRPAEAVRDALAAAAPADAVIVVGHLSAADREALSADAPGVDVLLTDFTTSTVAPDVHRFDLSSGDAHALPPPDAPAPGTPAPSAGAASLDAPAARPDLRALRTRIPAPVPVVPAGRARLGVVDLSFAPDGDGWRLARVESHAFPVTAQSPPDAEVLAAVQATRQAAYAPAQTVLLPDPGPALLAVPELRARFEADPAMPEGTARLTADLWRRLVAETVRDTLDAELALVPPVPYRRPLAGPVTRLDAVANLNVPDEVVVVSLTAAQVRAMAASPALADLVVAGLDPGPKVRGRALDDRERYRLATTDTVLADPRLRDVLAGPVARRLAASGGGLVESADGEPVTLRALVVRSLEGGDPTAVAERARPADAAPEGRWVLDFRGVALEGSSYEVFGERDAYAEVRDTRVVTAPNVALAAAGDVILRREGTSLTWLDQLHFRFAETRFDDGERLETTDELRLLTELQVDAWALAGPDHAVPFANLAYDTEFTPTPGNPRRKRLEGSLGVLWRGVDLLRAARLASVLGHDFAEDVPDPQVGFLAALELRQPFGVAVWGLTAEARYYLPDVGEDTTSELGAIVRARTSLDVPFFGGFAVGLFVDAYGFRGQVDATRDPGLSLWTGLALKYDRLWKPGYEW